MEEGAGLEEWLDSGSNFLDYLFIFTCLFDRTGLSCATCRIFSCCIRDPVPDQGTNPAPRHRTPHWESAVLTSIPPEKSLWMCFEGKLSRIC